MAGHFADIQVLSDRHLAQTYGRLPVAFVDGTGTRVRDTEGKEYLDFVGGLAVSALGHRHPAVVAAIRGAADHILHTSNLYYIEAQARLAARLAALSGLDRAFFANSGAEANEAAIKLARRYGRRDGHDRYKIVTALKSFHGRTLGALTATGQPKFHEHFGPLPGGFEYVPLNDIDALEAAVDETTAAVLLEPIQGESGVNPCTVEYLQAARAICDANGALLMLDEVQTGMGRTGRMFAFEHFGIRPDVMTLAKALGGGIPIGVMLATEDVAAAFVPGTHGTTFGGNPFACRVALAVLDVLENEQLPAVAEARGQRLRQGLAQLDGVAEVRGMGLMIGVELAAPDPSAGATPVGNAVDGVSSANSPPAGLAPRVMQQCLEQGLLVNAVGDSVLRLLPPLNVTEQEIDQALEIIETALSAARDVAGQRPD